MQSVSMSAVQQALRCTIDCTTSAKALGVNSEKENGKAFAVASSHVFS